MKEARTWRPMVSLEFGGDHGMNWRQYPKIVLINFHFLRQSWPMYRQRLILQRITPSSLIARKREIRGWVLEEARLSSCIKCASLSSASEIWWCKKFIYFHSFLEHFLAVRRSGSHRKLVHVDVDTFQMFADRRIKRRSVQMWNVRHELQNFQ